MLPVMRNPYCFIQPMVNKPSYVFLLQTDFHNGCLLPVEKAVEIMIAALK